MNDWNDWRAAALTDRRDEALAVLRAQSALREQSVAIFSSSTWRPIAALLEGELRLAGVAPRFAFCEYESMAAEIASGRATWDAALLAIDDGDAYAGLYDPETRFGEEQRTELLGQLRARIDRLAARCDALLVALPPRPATGPWGGDLCSSGESLVRRVERFRASLSEELAARSGVQALDLDATLAGVGLDRCLDPRLWQLGRIRYAPVGFLAIARAVAPRLARAVGLGIKAVVVDLDNTLWGGVVGEDGVDGIALGESYPGSCYRAFQQTLKRWRSSGLLLAVASKNNLEDARAVLDGHAHMFLHSEDFDRLEIHWQPKAISLARIIEAFNIGPEAVLFLDDNPRECEAVARAHPLVRVARMPDDPLEIPELLASLPWPLFTSASVEDRKRGELQAQQQLRREAAEQCGDRESYLASLGIEVDVSWNERSSVERIAQLHAKTNQFNADPRRYGAGEIESAMCAPDRGVMSVRYRDRFGDAGLVGCAVVDLSGRVPHAETFILSCRVIGLGVESALLAAIAARVPDGGLSLSYRCTDRNAPAREFIGGVAADALPAESGTVRIDARCCSVPPWVAVRESAAADAAGDSVAGHRRREETQRAT